MKIHPGFLSIISNNEIIIVLSLAKERMSVFMFHGNSVSYSNYICADILERLTKSYINAD